MQYTGIAAYPRRVCEYPISFHQLTKIEWFGIKGLLIICWFISLFQCGFNLTSMGYGIDSLSGFNKFSICY